jgi:hypothetical protein
MRRRLAGAGEAWYQAITDYRLRRSRLNANGFFLLPLKPRSDIADPESREAVQQ